MSVCQCQGLDYAAAKSLWHQTCISCVLTRQSFLLDFCVCLLLLFLEKRHDLPVSIIYVTFFTATENSAFFFLWVLSRWQLVPSCLPALGLFLVLVKSWRGLLINQTEIDGEGGCLVDFVFFLYIVHPWLIWSGQLEFGRKKLISPF